VASRLLCASLALTLPTSSGAQGAAVVTGRIIDTAGAPIIDANVRVPKLERVQAVDSAGRYRLEGVPTGRVTIVGEAPGFAGKRIDVLIGASGTVEQDFSLTPNAHVLANVAVRARAKRQLPLRLHEFEQRRTRGAGRFLGPDDLVKFAGRPLSDALKTVMAGARFQRNAVGELIIVSARSLNPAAIGGAALQRANMKPCGVQIWQDGALLSDPNQSLEIYMERPTAAAPFTTYPTAKIGADHDYDISSLLANDYAAVEYYADLASTPPGFRTGTPTCGTLVLWTRMPATGDEPSRVGQQPQ
jgi:hypothetical protein